MPSDRVVALSVVVALLVLGGAVSCSGVEPATGGARPGARATEAGHEPRQVLLAASRALDDVGSARVRVTEQSPAGSSTAAGTLSWGARDAAELELTDARGSARLLLVDGTCYLARQGSGEQHWLRTDRAHAGAAVAAGVAGAGDRISGVLSNPSGRVRAMALAGKLVTAGTEEDRGEPVVHYRGSAPVADFFGAEEGLGKQQLAAVVEDYRVRGVASVGYDFWVADGERLVRMRATEWGTAGTTVTETEVSDPGVLVEVQAPAPAEVVDSAGAAP
ncbi:hypothetical protein [Kitasatospora sp. NPDC050543]|uniref:hypothetical protein n=1 Tax=Kitasatospora sp. NPDC050543 TaxID=3364054 RepID=UPI0037A6660D